MLLGAPGHVNASEPEPVRGRPVQPCPSTQNRGDPTESSEPVTDQAVTSPERTPELPGLVWTVRRQGRTIAESDTTRAETNETLAALSAVRSRQGDVYVISSLDWSEPLPRSAWSTHLDRARLGLEAIAFVTETRTEIVTPERAIAWNQSAPEALQAFLHQGIGARTFELRAANATTRLVQIGDPPLETEIFRGTSLVPVEPDPGEDRALTIATGIASWMLENIDPGGRLPYLWNTSDESPDRHADNAIRRFLGAIGLGRFAACQDDKRMSAAYQLNLAHLLDRYLEPLGDGLAIIAEHPAANLGASALAGLAILAGPENTRDHPALPMLLRAVHSMTHERRGFGTHFYPPERDGQGWEFYSGEALLFLCEAARLGIRDAPEPEELLVLCRRCRDRWRDERHVACVSWHSQAATSLYRMRPLQELADYVFELNDWLLPLQPPAAAEPDRLGEFGDPLRPHHGTPHVSSTGVYLEGLADARVLARGLGDLARQRAYERAIALGLRSLRQHQFRDWRCTWYLNRPEAVLGALRSNVHDNRVRIDNCGHALAALTKFLSPTDLPAPTQGAHPPTATEEADE